MNGLVRDGVLLMYDVGVEKLRMAVSSDLSNQQLLELMENAADLIAAAHPKPAVEVKRKRARAKALTPTQSPRLKVDDDECFMIVQAHGPITTGDVRLKLNVKNGVEYSSQEVSNKLSSLQRHGRILSMPGGPDGKGRTWRQVAPTIYDPDPTGDIINS